MRPIRVEGFVIPKFSLKSALGPSSLSLATRLSEMERWGSDLDAPASSIAPTHDFMRLPRESEQNMYACIKLSSASAQRYNPPPTCVAFAPRL